MGSKVCNVYFTGHLLFRLPVERYKCSCISGLAMEVYSRMLVDGCFWKRCMVCMCMLVLVCSFKGRHPRVTCAINERSMVVIHAYSTNLLWNRVLLAHDGDTMWSQSAAPSNPSQTKVYSILSNFFTHFWLCLIMAYFFNSGPLTSASLASSSTTSSSTTSCACHTLSTLTIHVQ